MIHYLKDQILANNNVQQAIPTNMLVDFFSQGIDLWYFIEEYEEYDDQWDGYDEDPDAFCPFPMTCIGLSQEDTVEDIDEGKTYYAQTENFLEYASSGDGIGYEYWEHIITKDIYKVPIEIVRDFNNATIKK